MDDQAAGGEDGVRLMTPEADGGVGGWRYWLLFLASALIGAAAAGCFVVFCISYSNYPAGMWALSGAVFAFATMHLHVLNMFNHVAAWHDVQSLTQVKYLALGVCALSTIGGSVFGALALRMKQEIDFGDNNFVIATIAACLSLLAGLDLLLTAVFYRSQLAAQAQRQRMARITADEHQPGTSRHY